MEIGVANNLTNFGPSQPNRRTSADSEPEAPNAFGIGSANRPEVELSPQARILQQNEETNRERQQALDENLRGDQNEQDDQEQEQQAISGNDFVRVSSSVGSAQRNNLTTERATEVYRSIQGLL